MDACVSFKIEDFNKDYHPKGDHGNPKGYNQGLRPCMVSYAQLKGAYCSSSLRETIKGI